MFETKQKPWGVSRTVLLNDKAEITEIFVAAGGFCSLHCHDRKENIFAVLAGELLVESFDCGLEKIQQQRLLMPDHAPLVIRPGIKHRFIARTDVLAVELYRPTAGEKIDPNDIVRFSEGGRNHA